MESMDMTSKDSLKKARQTTHKSLEAKTAEVAVKESVVKRIRKRKEELMKTRPYEEIAKECELRNPKEAKTTAEMWIKNLTDALEDYKPNDSTETYYKGKIEGIRETVEIYESQIQKLEVDFNNVSEIAKYLQREKEKLEADHQTELTKQHDKIVAYWEKKYDKLEADNELLQKAQAKTDLENTDDTADRVADALDDQSIKIDLEIDGLKEELATANQERDGFANTLVAVKELCADLGKRIGEALKILDGWDTDSDHTSPNYTPNLKKRLRTVLGSDSKP